MQPRWWISVFFLISFSMYFTGFSFIKKNDKKINFVLWLPLNLVLSYGILAFICGIINIIMPINLITVSVLCALLGIFFWYKILKKGKQKFYFEWFDIVPFIICAMVAVFFAYNQFTGSLLPIYETSDPSVHFQMALKILNKQKLSGMYFAPLINALVIEFFGVFVENISYYKLFILSDIFMFLMSGVVFYSVTALNSKNIKYKLCATFLTVVYMMGFPLNNMIFGFVYLGISVTVILVLIALVKSYVENEFEHSFTVFCLMILCFSIALCYSFFAPPVFFALLAVGVFVFAKKKELITFKFVFEQLKIFLAPCIILLCYMFINRSTSGISALSVEGYIYKELYSDFYLLIPPSLFVVYKCFKDRKIRFSAFLLVFVILFMAIILPLGLKGVFSSYYYYKLYYPLWGICFYLTYLAIEEIGEKNLSLAVSSFACLVICFFIAVSGTNKKIQDINMQFNPTDDSYELFDVYQFNSQRIIEGDDTEKIAGWNSKFELYNYVFYNNLQSDKPVQIVADWQSTYWYEGLLNEPMEDYYWIDPEKAMRSISENDYVVVLKNSDMYIENQEYFDGLEKLFSNSIGFVARI